MGVREREKKGMDGACDVQAYKMCMRAFKNDIHSFS